MAFDPPDDWKAPRTGPNREPTAADWTDPFLRSPHAADGPRGRGRAVPAALRPGGGRPLRLPHGLGLAAIAGRGRRGGGVLRQRIGRRARPRWPCRGTCSPAPPGCQRTPSRRRPTSSFSGADPTSRGGNDDGPVGLLYLALRTARRAVRDDPDDARAYLVLGETYLRLLTSTAERRGLPAAGLLEQTDRGNPAILPRPHHPGDRRLHARPAGSTPICWTPTPASLPCIKT